MTAKKALSVWFNQMVAVSEFGGTYFLTFFVLFVIFITKKTKNKNKLLTSLLYTLITFISIVLFWALARPISRDFPISYINPINVIFDTIIEKMNSSGNINAFKGLTYILGFQALGTTAGFLTFYGLYALLRWTQNSYFENLPKLSFKEITFINYNEKTSGFAIKELIFIFLFAITIPFMARVNPVTSGLLLIHVVMINMVILFVILYLSSYFNFYAFHIFIAAGFCILNLMLDKKNAGKNLAHFGISLGYSIIIPSIIGIITFAIVKQGGMLNAY